MIRTNVIRFLILMCLVAYFTAPVSAERGEHNGVSIEEVLGLGNDVVVGDDGLIYSLQRKTHGAVVGFVEMNQGEISPTARTCKCNADASTLCPAADCNVKTCNGTQWYCRWYGTSYYY